MIRVRIIRLRAPDLPDNFLISVPAPHFIVHGRPEILLGPVKVGGGAVGASGGQAGQPVGSACGAEVVVVQGHCERCLPTYRMLGSHADVARIATRLAPSVNIHKKVMNMNLCLRIRSGVYRTGSTIFL